MHQIKPVLARRDKSDLRPRATPHAFVDLVCVGKSLCRKSLVVDHPCFLIVWRIQQTDVQAPVRHVEIRGYKLHPVRTAIHYGGGLDRVFHRL